MNFCLARLWWARHVSTVIASHKKKYIVDVLGDTAIEQYGREDLHDVFQAIKPFGLFKACESSCAGLFD